MTEKMPRELLPRKLVLLASLLRAVLGQDVRVVSTPARHVVTPPSRSTAAGLSTGSGTGGASSGLSSASVDLLKTLKGLKLGSDSGSDALPKDEQQPESGDTPSTPDNRSDSSSSGSGSGGRKLLARLELTNTGSDCFDGVGPCEAPPIFIPSSGYGFNHAGAVSLHLGRPGATVRYTLDGTEPDRQSKGYIADNMGGGVVELRVDPPCPANTFSNASRPTYCTFAPQQRNVTLLAKAMSRYNSTTQDSAAVIGHYTIYTGRHGRAMLVPYYHGEANEQSPAQRAVAAPTGFRRETGLGYSGKLVEVQLDTMPFRRVHLHDVITDFAEYSEFFDKTPKSSDPKQTDSDTVSLDVRDSDESANQFMDGAFSSGAKTAHEFEVTAYGVKPLPTTSEWSRALGTCPYGKSADLRNTPKGQVTVLDLAAALKEGAWGELPASSSSNGDDDDAYGGRSNDLRGFWSGFEATGKDGISYGILVPFFDGVAYSGLAARVDLDAFYSSSNEDSRRSAVSLLNLTSVSPRARGFARGFSHDGYAYFVPLFDGTRAGSLVTRVSVATFDVNTVEFLDLANPDTPAGSSDADDDVNDASEVPRKSLAGFQGGQAYVGKDGKSYGLLVPYRHSFSPLGGANSKLTADGFNALDVMREVEAVGGGHQTVAYASNVVRFELPSTSGAFSTTSVSTIDLAAVDADLRGFSDGVVVGQHLYLVPYRNRDSLMPADLYGYFGKVVQLDLEAFDQGYRAVRTLDLTQLDHSLVGFSSGLYWGKFLLLVPMRNAQGGGAAGAPGGVTGSKREQVAMGGNHMKRAMHGKLVGIDLTLPFGTLQAVHCLDLSTVTRQQIPKIPDPELRGFSGGFAAGDYTYLVPYSNGVFFGKLVRVDMRDFEALARKQKRAKAQQAAYAAQMAEQGRPYPRSLLLHDGTDDGSRTGTNSLGHDGVQVLDVQWQDKQLCGFSGGFSTIKANSTRRR